MNAEDRYNGWTNRETWAAALHLSNDEGLYNAAREIAQRDEYGDAVKSMVEEIYEDVLHNGTAAWTDRQTARMLVADVGSLWRVDWKAVRDSLVEE
jgi:hypothetical protein